MAMEGRTARRHKPRPRPASAIIYQSGVHGPGFDGDEELSTGTGSDQVLSISDSLTLRVLKTTVPLPPSTLPRSLVKPTRPVSHPVSPIVQKALVIARRAAINRVRQCRFRSDSLRNLISLSPDEKANVLLDRFLQRIQRMKSGSLKGGSRTVKPRSGPISVNNSTRPGTGFRGRYRSRAAVPPIRSTQDGDCDGDQDMIQRKERIRRRSMDINGAVIMAKERVKLVKERAQEEIEAVLKAAMEDDKERERESLSAVYRARQRVWHWRTNHKGDDRDPIYRYDI
uniref:Uncharacterized protein n=1 Tax=Spongospora subterranea TaxID=70186 RepID=A0A0H5RBV1_9EUKA|eukprot:CRZ11508.1 hypothetical protein [Spongospora subterranea]